MEMLTDRKIAPQNALIPQTCKYATSHGKKDFAGMIELRLLSRGRDLELSQRCQCNPKVFIQREDSPRGGVRMEAEVKVMWEANKGHRWLPERRTGWDADSPMMPSEGPSPALDVGLRRQT